MATSKKKKTSKMNDEEKQAMQQDNAAGEATPDGDRVELNDISRQLEAMTAENERLRDQMLRARAEFENYKRRRAQEMEQFSSLANEGLISDLIPILDDFDLMVANAEKGGEASHLLEGARMIRQKLFSALERRGLELIDAKDKPFDPEVHEALLQVPSPGAEPGTVIEVHQPGYRLANKLLRPSRVIVAAETDGEN